MGDFLSTATFVWVAEALVCVHELNVVCREAKSADIMCDLKTESVVVTDFYSFQAIHSETFALGKITVGDSYGTGLKT